MTLQTTSENNATPESACKYFSFQKKKKYTDCNNIKEPLSKQLLLYRNLVMKETKSEHVITTYRTFLKF